MKKEERKILTDPDVVTMDKFEKCLIKEDYSCLVESGYFTATEKRKAWNDLYLSYLDAENSSRTKTMVELNKKIVSGKYKIDVLNLCIMILSNKNEVISDFAFDTCMEIFKGYGFALVSKIDHEKRLKELRTITGSIKSISIGIQISSEKIKSFTKENPRRMNEKDLTKTFIVLNSKFKYGFEITKQNTTVSKFCSMINMLQN